MKSNKAYLALMAFQLTCIGIKYEAFNTNPFHQSTLFLLFTAMFSHVLASAADINKPITTITFHFSGILLLPGTPPSIVEMPNTEPQSQESQVFEYLIRRLSLLQTSRLRSRCLWATI
ncbi:uncharacterized protein [Phaseolus vulgaris]|uniref:uncharacterized protein isoform X3 n=1 Tax=Phaseolus vulgaris TaxID=3885 RepID=UPI0035CB3786